MADYCDHCDGQRFDRAQVLRALRQIRRDLRRQHCGKRVDAMIELVVKTVAQLELPHLLVEEEGGQVVH